MLDHFANCPEIGTKLKSVLNYWTASNLWELNTIHNLLSTCFYGKTICWISKDSWKHGVLFTGQQRYAKDIKQQRMFIYVSRRLLIRSGLFQTAKQGPCKQKWLLSICKSRSLTSCMWLNVILTCVSISYYMYTSRPPTQSSIIMIFLWSNLQAFAEYLSRKPPWQTWFPRRPRNRVSKMNLPLTIINMKGCNANHHCMLSPLEGNL